MDINASIVDQRLTGILEEHAQLLPAGLEKDPTRQRAAAFVLLCTATLLDLPLNDAADLLTEGGQDEGVDALHFGEVEEGEFAVTLFQAKYKMKDLSGTANFPENGVQKALDTIAVLFDPARQLHLNERLAPRIEEIRSLIREGNIPVVRVVLCNNGAVWPDSAQKRIAQSGFPAEQVTWTHFNHASIVGVLQKHKSVDDSLRLSGKAVIEEFNYRRVLIGKVPVTEIAQLFARQGDLLLERNIRRYLGTHGNRVNHAIFQTLTHAEKRDDFYFYNNGITMICRKFRHNALQGENYQIKLEGMQVINGGQTCKTIERAVQAGAQGTSFDNVYVLLRLYELAEDDQDFVREITYTTNSQNPVDLRDLRSNDEIQKQLEIGMRDLGYHYKRQREDGGLGSQTISATVLAESCLACLNRMPHQAKCMRKEHFGKLYETIFNGLQAAPAIISVWIFRFVESLRKSYEGKPSQPIYIPYASHYLAMQMMTELLARNHLKREQLSHQNFAEVFSHLQIHQLEIYNLAQDKLRMALNVLYGNRQISLQQFAATFRRGDLLEYLN